MYRSYRSAYCSVVEHLVASSHYSARARGSASVGGYIPDAAITYFAIKISEHVKGELVGGDVEPIDVAPTKVSFLSLVLKLK